MGSLSKLVSFIILSVNLFVRDIDYYHGTHISLIEDGLLLLTHIIVSLKNYDYFHSLFKFYFHLS